VLDRLLPPYAETPPSRTCWRRARASGLIPSRPAARHTSTGSPAGSAAATSNSTGHYVQAAKDAGHLHPDGGPGWPTWNAARHLELTDQWGIATSILSISSPGGSFGDPAAVSALARHVNDAGAEVRRAHPGRFGHFASLPLPVNEAEPAGGDRANTHGRGSR
jgi:hypothetical protein